ncbi:hypothetical protein SmJEL517_g02542 [Synchytrium microbalum]|uniref:Maltose/galactoside acetyltransferase domain-containing protein n=1 Tax=Synchytrium microbalum TaxID=1806994 RepID=A0A507C033_9FUNG|nr:uncharacterized protein SmJEL517_g02542 [Synchytrium microbalum]TPX34890.1 hypothetical protein SmJEL517_g02542 [Synchytrium microbalum]
MGKKTEKEKALAGELYNANDKELVDDREACKKLIRKYNHPDREREELPKILKELLVDDGKTDPPFIEPPFYCDYGYNITYGKNVYMNHNCIILDCNKVTIGDNVMFAPNVAIYAATHPLEAEIRRDMGPELAFPVTIGSDVWIGGNSVILPGVTIGDGAVVGAGSVVTKDVAPYTVVVGNPAHFLKDIPREKEKKPVSKKKADEKKVEEKKAEEAEVTEEAEKEAPKKRTSKKKSSDETEEPEKEAPKKKKPKK